MISSLHYWFIMTCQFVHLLDPCQDEEIKVRSAAIAALGSQAVAASATESSGSKGCDASLFPLKSLNRCRTFLLIHFDKLHRLACMLAVQKLRYRMGILPMQMRIIESWGPSRNECWIVQKAGKETNFEAWACELVGWTTSYGRSRLSPAFDLCSYHSNLLPLCSVNS